MAADPRRTPSKNQSRGGSATLTVWQKESFDHIVRSPESLEKFRQYIRAHNGEEPFQLIVSEKLRRDAAATLALEACAPFDKPEVRETLVKLRQQNVQTIDHVTIDNVLSQQFDAAPKEKAESLIKTFRDYIAQHPA